MGGIWGYDETRIAIRVESLNKDTFGTSHFVLRREVVLFQR